MNQKALLIADALLEHIGAAGADASSLIDQAISAAHHHGVTDAELRLALRRSLKKANKELSVELVTPTGDAGDAAESIQSIVSKAVGRPVHLSQKAAPILGGAIVSLHDDRLDYSVKTALTQLERSFTHNSSSAL